MKKKILALSLLLSLTIVMITCLTPPVKAVGVGQWITTYKIEDATSGQLLVQYDPSTNTTNILSPVLPDTTIKVTFTIDIIAPGADTLKIQTSLVKSGNVFWEPSSDYPMGNTFNPGSATTTFKWAVGTLDMVLYGTVPPASTSANVSRTINVVTLSSGSGGQPLDRISLESTTAGLANFNILYNQQSNKLQSLKDSGVAQGYIELFQNVLSSARSLADSGNINDATTLLNGLNVSNEPVGSAMEVLFLPIVAVVAVIAAIFAFLFMRVRGKVGYVQLVVEDQIKDLEGLSLRAAKIDRTLSASLESVKDRLSRISGE